LDLTLSNPVTPLYPINVNINDLMPKVINKNNVKNPNESLFQLDKCIQSFTHIISKTYFDCYQNDLKNELKTELTEFELRKIRE